MTERATSARDVPLRGDDAPLLPVWQVAGLVAVVVLAMGRVVTHEFTTWDDPSTIYRNPMFNPPDWGQILAAWDPRVHKYGLWVPVTYTVWGVLAELGQLTEPDALGARLNPAVFHGASLAVHIVTTVLVYVLLRRLLAWAGVERRAGAAAWLGAAVFGVHPLQVESVAWASGLKDLLWGLLAMSAVLAYLSCLDGDGRPRRNRWWWLGLGLFVLGTLSKPTAMVVPVLAGCVHVGVVLWPRVGWSRAVRMAVSGLWPWLAFVPVVAAWTRWAQPGGGVPTLELWLRPLIATDALAFYLWKLVWPFELTFDYGRHPPAIAASGALWWTWVVPAVVLAGVVWVCWRWGVGRPLRGGAGLLAAGVAWAVVAIGPVLGLTPFMFQFFSTVADHYVYVAMAGVGMAVAWGVSAASERLWPAVRVAAAVVLVGLMVRSAHQMGFWRDSETLYARSLAVNPNSFATYTNLGGMLMYRGDSFFSALAPEADLPQRRADYRRALAYYDRAVQIRPDYSLAWDHRAVALFKLGEAEAGLASLLKAVETAGRVPAGVRGPMTVTHLLLGQFFLERGRYEQALRHLEEARAENERFGRSLPPDDLARLEMLERRAKEALAASQVEERPPLPGDVRP